MLCLSSFLENGPVGMIPSGFLVVAVFRRSVELLSNLYQQIVGLLIILV